MTPDEVRDALQAGITELRAADAETMRPLLRHAATLENLLERLEPITDPADVLADVAAEVDRAQRLFLPMNSPHEGIAVIREEYRELRDEVEGNTGRTPAAYTEAVQLAAMAVRYASELCEVVE